MLEGSNNLAAKKEKPAELREAMDILFGLLDHIDECRDDVIFFADEGGSRRLVKSRRSTSRKRHEFFVRFASERLPRSG